MSLATDHIRAKRDLYVAKREQLTANLNVVSGAIGACDELLNAIATAETAEAADQAEDISEVARAPGETAASRKPGVTARPPARTKQARK